MHDHVSYYYTCSHVQGLQGLDCFVEYDHAIGFIIVFEGYEMTRKAITPKVIHHVILSSDVLSSASYTHCMGSLLAKFPNLLTSKLSYHDLVEYEQYSMLTTDTVYQMLNVIPSWLLGTTSKFQTKLDTLHKPDLVDCFLCVSNEQVPKTKGEIISFILQQFMATHDCFILMRERPAECPESWYTFQNEHSHE